ncbi:MAG TPA: hypothetical protein VFT90_10095 [Chryseosolibacter sp.]|nr:hypothetical protein [Chryseosolibacter sp.]
MNSRSAVFSLLLLISVPATAQKDTTIARPSWFMTIDGGLLLARRAIESAPSIRMRQGIRYKRFALSAGVGYDSYKHWSTLPLFTGASVDFVQRPAHAFYLELDAGYSPSWYRRKEMASTALRDAGGHFFHPSIGYRGGVGKVQIHISAGYKVQKIEWRETQPTWGWRSSHEEVTINQKMRRLSFLIGIGLR